MNARRGRLGAGAGIDSARAMIGRLRLPVVAAPMFLVSSPELVVAAAESGIIGAFPTLNARTAEDLERWLDEITTRLGSGPAGSWAANLIAHQSNPRLHTDLELLQRYRPPMVITALGSPRGVVEAVHDFGGLVLADVVSVEYARKAAEAGVDGLDPERPGGTGGGGIDVTDDPHSGARRWKDIWSAGHGVGSVDAVRSVAALVERLSQGYARTAAASEE